MQPRFAALLFALGLCDLVYVNLGLGPEVFASSVEPETPPTQLPPSPPPARRETNAPGPNGPAPAPSPNEPAPAPSPNDAPPSADSSLAGALPEAPGAPSALELPRPAAPLELASEPAARDAVEAGRAGDAELTQLTADLTVAFPDTASALLTRAAREELLTLAARLRERPTYRLRLVGHADSRGTREFNKYLGGRRARAVFELLTAAGVAPEQLELESRGEEEPRVAGTSEEVLAVNRRVEIRIASERSETP